MREYRDSYLLADRKCEYCGKKAVTCEIIGYTTWISAPHFKRVSVYFVCEKHTDSPMNDVK